MKKGVAISDIKKEATEAPVTSKDPDNRSAKRVMLFGSIIKGVITMRGAGNGSYQEPIQFFESINEILLRHPNGINIGSRRFKVDPKFTPEFIDGFKFAKRSGAWN